MEQKPKIDPNQVLRHLKYLYEIRQSPVAPIYIEISMSELTRAQEVMHILDMLAKNGVIRQVRIGTAQVVAYEPL